jgi:hypothetical protein
MKNKLSGAVDALVVSQTKELRLPTVGSRYGDLADQAAREGMPHRDYLAHLFEHELDDRSERRAERRLLDARFPHRKRLEDFKFEQSVVNAAQLHQLAKGEYIARAENVIFIGDSGTGKAIWLLGWASLPASRAGASASPPWPASSTNSRKLRTVTSFPVSSVAMPASNSSSWMSWAVRREALMFRAG